MKIAHVVDCMEVGGVEVLVAQMCRLQRELGHDPYVYIVLGLGPLGERLRAEGFVVRANIGRNFLHSAWNLYCIFKETHPDAVHLHNPTPAFYAALAARMAGVPRIVATRHSLVAPPRRKLTELKFALAAVFCDYIIGICDATVSNLKSLRTVQSRKIARIYNSVAPIRPLAPEQCPEKSGFTLLYAGRLAAVKNLPLLLSAFHLAQSQMPELRLWIVGDGSERARLEDLTARLNISTQVTFWGQQLDVAPFYSAADAFTMASTSEGLPVSLLQAFSIGMPAIVTDVGGMAEAVRLARAGMIVPIADPEPMATAILRMATCTVARNRFSENARSAFQSNFTLKAMVDGYLDLYRNKSRPQRQKAPV